MQVFGHDLSVTIALLKHLKERFPDTLPSHEITIEELYFLQGQQTVVKYLESLYNQINNIE